MASRDARWRASGAGDLGSAFRRAELLHRPLIRLGVELLQRVLALVADSAEDRTPLPGAVVQAVYPGDVGEGVRVAPVQEVAVVEPERPGESFLGRRRPFQDLLAPVHPQLVVHVTGLA